MTEFDNVLLPTQVAPFEPALAPALLDGEVILSASAIAQIVPGGDPILQDDAGGEGDDWILLLQSTASSDALAGGIVGLGDEAFLLNLIATPEEEEEQVITITGHDDGGGGPSGGEGGDTGYSGNGMGTGGTSDDSQPSCIETTLESGASTAEANREALEAANKIKGSSFKSYEYSSIIWAKNGEVGHTEPYTDRMFGDVNLLGGLSGVPEGAVIIGILHSHTDDPLMNDSYPSGAGSEPGGDWDGYDTIVNHAFPRGITADRNMLFWILNAEDNKVRAYDNTDKNLTQASCAIG